MSTDVKNTKEGVFTTYSQEKAHTENIEAPNTATDNVIDLFGIEETATSKAAWLICLCASIGGFLFGYDTGYISAVLVTLGSALGRELSSSEQELVTSLTSGGAFVGAVAAGLTADRFGRRLPIWCACVTFVVGTLLQCVAYSIPQFAVGRFVIGLGVGSAAMIVPLYISEIAPAKYRGRMVAFNNTSVTLGQLVASCIGAGCANFHNGWRLTVGIGGLPPIILAGLLFMCPESPRQLVTHDKKEAADAVLLRIYPTSTREQRQAKLQSIELSIKQTTESMQQESLWTAFKHILNSPPTGRAVLTACIIMAISQLGGFNTLMYYAATLFSIVGWKNPTAVGITVSAANFVFGILTIFLVDRVGRRVLLSISVAGMAICLAIAAIAFSFIPINKDLVLQSDPVGWPGILILVTIICYVGFFSSGVAPISWVGTELMPLEVRAIGTMLNTATCWGTNIIISSTFLSMMKGITPSGAFGFYCGICSLGWILIIFFYPECKGMPLEAVREVFSQGFGVRYSKKWQKGNKHLRVQSQMTIGH